MAEKGMSHSEALVVDHTMPCKSVCSRSMLFEAMLTIIWECGKKFVFMFLQLATSFGL